MGYSTVDKEGGFVASDAWGVEVLGSKQVLVFWVKVCGIACTIQRQKRSQSIAEVHNAEVVFFIFFLININNLNYNLGSIREDQRRETALNYSKRGERQDKT